MRDALSTLDLIRTFSKDSKITLEIVTKNLNILDNEYFFNISNLLYESKFTEIILLHNEILQKGFESYSLLNGLSNHFRNLLLSKNKKLVEILEVSDNEKSKYIDQSSKIETEFIEKALEVLNKFEINYKQSSDSKIHTEIALIKICSLSKKKTLKSKEEQIETPEKKEFKKEIKEEKVKKIIEKPKSENDIINKDTPNLKNLLITKNEEVKTENELKKEEIELNKKVSFSEEKFNLFINSFIDSLKEKKSEVAILNKQKVIEGTSVTFYLDNKLEGSIYDSILNRLNERLKNRFTEKITLNKIINQTKKEKTIYTNKEKFEYLVKKNDNLNQLKSKLGLDYEF